MDNGLFSIVKKTMFESFKLDRKKRGARDAGRFVSFPLGLCPRSYRFAWMNTPQLLPAGMAPHPHRSSDCPKGKCRWVGGQKEPGCEGHRTGHCAERGGYRKGNPGEAHVCLTVTVTSISACGNNSLMVSLLFLPVQLCNVRGAPLGSNDLGSFYNNNLSLYIQEEWPKGSKLKSLKCFFPLIYMMFTTAGAEKMWDLDSL